MSESKNEQRPAIWISDRGKYNEGILTGKWTHLDDFEDAEELKEEIEKILKETRGEEWFISAYEFLPTTLGENPDIERLWEIYEIIEEHGFEEVEAFLNCFSLDDLTEEEFTERFLGEHSSVVDYAYEFVKETGLLQGCSEIAERYFSYEALARDMVLGGDICTSSAGGGGVYIFSNN